MQQLDDDDFFTIFPLDAVMQIGEHFAYLYRRTADIAPADQIIHLCYLDRLAFALEGEYRDSFLAEIDSLCADDLPLIFHRSSTAWDTHPANYRALEGFVTTIGEILFGKTLDYGWCHLVASAGQLRKIMPSVKRPGLSVVAEMIYYLQENIHTREVDWLAWEDPFIYERDPLELKQERQNSHEETQKRLSYVLPMVEMLVKFSKDGKVNV